ncbi:MAG: YicC family protein [Deltaproteobacteria bacterium]|nr:YicC family protein [Deltaproteobacteria bacterium]
MIRSMTGYGMSEFSIGENKFSLEIKSVNHRFIEINNKSPDRFSLLENKIRDTVKQSCSRGCLYIFIAFVGEITGTLKANIPLARHYLNVLYELQKGLGLKQEVDMSMLFKFKDIFTSVEARHDLEGDWAGLKPGLEIAINSLLKMRKEEGDVLANDIASRLACMEDIASKIEALAPVVAERYKEKLRQRIAGAFGNINVDEARLLTEIAIFAERIDITEELVRLRGHVMRFKDMLKSDEPVGRKMDFLCQEILREINTVGSKANDFEVANLVVLAKAELEKIREQAQNIE